MKFINAMFIIASLASAAFVLGGLVSVIQQSMSEDSSVLIEPHNPPERIQDVNVITV